MDTKQENRTVCKSDHHNKQTEVLVIYNAGYTDGKCPLCAAMDRILELEQADEDRRADKETD